MKNERVGMIEGYRHSQEDERRGDRGAKRIERLCVRARESGGERRYRRSCLNSEYSEGSRAATGIHVIKLECATCREIFC